MKPTVILSAALLCALSPISIAKPLKVFILAGQSNMEGHAAISTLTFTVGSGSDTTLNTSQFSNLSVTP